MNAIKNKWLNSDFVEFSELPEIPQSSLDCLNWFEYETYMRATIIDSCGDDKTLLVEFPPEGSEDNQLHTHPLSDRCVTTVTGSGEFIYYWEKEIKTLPLSPGVRIWMPRGILHTFRAFTEGLLVTSLHSPFIPVEDKNCLIYPKLEIKI